VEKLSLKLLFIASMAVMMPTRAIIPKAIIATVIPVRNLFALTVLQARTRLSRSFMT
jgi:hypothetical protein